MEASLDAQQTSLTIGKGSGNEMGLAAFTQVQLFTQSGDGERETADAELGSTGVAEECP